jgi:hypothetical protein
MARVFLLPFLGRGHDLYTNGGYGWLVAVKERVGGKLRILAERGGAAIASHATNVLFTLAHAKLCSV